MVPIPAIDRRGLAFVVLLLGPLAAWYALDPGAFAESIRGPASYFQLVLLGLLAAASVFRDARESWLYGLLFGAFLAAWGFNNLSGETTPYLTGYGFVALGVSGAAYALYGRFRRNRSSRDAA